MRTKIVITIFTVVWLTILVRIYYLAVNSNDYYEELSQKNTIKTELIAPIRGEILDRNHKPLAINQLGFKVLLKPHLSKKKRIQELYTEVNFLKKYIKDINVSRIMERYKREDSYYNHDYIEIVDFISYKKFMPIYTKLNLRENIKIEASHKRYYPYKDIAAHLIGYVAKANLSDMKKDDVVKLVKSVGKSGVEKYYNTFLEGELGSKTIKVTAKNEIISVLKRQKAIENRKLTLSIDIEMQEYIKKLFKGKSGSVIVMQSDGRIISLGSYPEYNLNTFVNGITSKEWNNLINDLKTPFTNKATKGLYPPGSTIKPGLGLIYITEGGISEWWNDYCTGSMMLGKRNFRCWKKVGHHKTNIIKAIRESCDDYFYKGSLKVGIKTISDGLMKFGLGKKTGIDLANEFIGTVPSRIWKMNKYHQPWYRGETLNTSIGQGDFLVTPLQIAQFTNLIATGKLVRPTLAYKENDAIVKTSYKNVLSREQKSKLPIIQTAMHQVCNHPKGTATHYITTDIDLACKTGTAQVVGISQNVKKRLKEHEMRFFRRSHAWLTSYGPYKDPKVVVTVLVEHGGHGGSAAGKIVSKIYDKLKQKGYLK